MLNLAGRAVSLHLHHSFQLLLLLLLVARQQTRVKAVRPADLRVVFVDVRPRTSLRRHRRLRAADRRQRCRRVPDRRLTRQHGDTSSRTASIVVRRTTSVGVVVVRSTMTGMWLPEIQRDAVPVRPRAQLTIAKNTMYVETTIAVFVAKAQDVL